MKINANKQMPTVHMPVAPTPTQPWTIIQKTFLQIHFDFYQKVYFWRSIDYIPELKRQLDKQVLKGQEPEWFWLHGLCKMPREGCIHCDHLKFIPFFSALWNIANIKPSIENNIINVSIYPMETPMWYIKCGCKFFAAAPINISSSLTLGWSDELFWQ